MTTDTLKQAAQAALELARCKKSAIEYSDGEITDASIAALSEADELTALAAALEAMAEQEPDGYIHPDNARRLVAGETVAFRKKPYAHDGGGIPVFVGISIATPEHDAQVRNAALRKMVDAMFTSGNAIPVERITITRKQFEEALKTTGGAA